MYVLGVDGGTESVRASLFDLAGNQLAFAAATYHTYYPRTSWAEQDPSDWIRCVGTAVKGCVEQARRKGLAGEIKAMSLDTTCCTVVALDSGGAPLRNAILWMDMRAAEQAARVSRTSDDALRVNGAGQSGVSAEWMIPKALWLKENERETYDQAATICEYQDFMNLYLTGRLCCSVNNVSIRWHYDVEKGWPISLLDALGMPEILKKWPKDVLKLGENVGGLTEDAALHLGLPVGLPVAQGGADAFVGLIGLGVIQHGQMGLLMGSSHLHLGCTKDSFENPGIWGTYRSAVIDGLNIVEGGQTSTGSIIAWYKRMTGEEYSLLNRQAEHVAPGCDGVLCIDHFQGNRTPWTDPLSRGAITGLSLNHTKAHVYRALIESICYGTECVLESMRDGGFSANSIVVAGGPTKSPLWLQIHADVSQVPFVVTKVSDAPALGSAICAAVSASLFKDIQSACEVMVHVDRVVHPNPTLKEVYQHNLKRYKALYKALKDT
jgi:ribulokinase